MQQPGVYKMTSTVLVMLSTIFSLSLSQVKKSESDYIVEEVGRKVGKKGRISQEAGAGYCRALNCWRRRCWKDLE